MRLRRIFFAAAVLAVVPLSLFSQGTTLELLIHQNAPLVDYIASFNEKFQKQYPDITVNVSVVKADELATSTQTRLTAGDVDIIDMFGFAQGIQPFMKGADKPNWQTLIEAGLLMDLSGQPFLKNYDAAAIRDAGSFNGKVYEVNTGRYAFTGVFYNKDLFKKYGVKVPTTWGSARSRVPDVQEKQGCSHDCGRQGRMAGARGGLRHTPLRLPRPGGAREGALERHDQME